MNDLAERMKASVNEVSIHALVKRATITTNSENVVQTIQSTAS